MSLRHLLFLTVAMLAVGFGINVAIAESEPAATQPVDVPTEWVGLWGGFNIEQGRMLDKDHCKRIECVIESRDGQWHARFEGECSRPYKYTITMQGRPVDGVLLFKGTVDLGPEDGGVYDWIGRADEHHFVGFYTNAHHTGVFRMTPKSAASADRRPPLLDFTMDDIHGKPVDLSTFAGKVVLFVNVASRCGYTKQYAGLQSLYETYRDRGLVIIGVPANNFGGQEPGTNDQIAAFCSTTYGVTFPMLGKVSVKGDDTCDLYRALIAAAESTDDPGDVKWNFEKFLLGRDGELIGRYRSKVTPDDPQLVAAIEAALQ